MTVTVKPVKLDLINRWDDLQARIRAAKAAGNQNILNKLEDELHELRLDFAYVRSLSE